MNNYHIFPHIFWSCIDFFKKILYIEVTIFVITIFSDSTACFEESSFLFGMYYTRSTLHRKYGNYFFRAY